MFVFHFEATGIVSKETGKFYTEIFDMRQSGDYMDFIEFVEDDVAPLLIPARKFIEQIEEILSK